MNRVSPNELLEEAKAHMLDGREPTTDEDYQLVMNFFAANIEKSCCLEACRLLRTIYSMPLSDEDVDRIVDFQLTNA